MTVVIFFALLSAGLECFILGRDFVLYVGFIFFGYVVPDLFRLGGLVGGRKIELAGSNEQGDLVEKPSPF